MSLAQPSSPDLDIQAFTGLLASVQLLPASEDTRMPPPPHGEAAGPAALGILTAAAAWPLPYRAPVQMTQQTRKSKAPKLSLLPLFT